jgi:hypothetical protein
MLRGFLGRLGARLTSGGLHPTKSLEDRARDHGLLLSESRLTVVEGLPIRIVAELVLTSGEVLSVVLSPEGAHRLSDTLLQSAAMAMGLKRSEPFVPHKGAA